MSERRSIPIARPFFGRAEERNFLSALRSGWVTQGPWVERFEDAVSGYTGAPHAVAVNSCTSAQMAAALCAGIGPGDEAVIPAFTWVSTASSVEYLGARPVFADIDLDTFTLDPAALQAAVSTRTKAVLPVHLFGRPAEMKAILRVAKRHRLRVIEDCACSLGGTLGKIHTGLFGDCGCFSFHPRKSVTTGEGGVLVTRSARFAREVRACRNHGAFASDYGRHKGKAPYRLPRFPRLGFNFRMTDLQAAVGVAQMEKLDIILEKRARLAAAYSDALAGNPFIRLPGGVTGGRHGWQAFVCIFGPPRIEEDGRRAIDRWHLRRNAVMEALESDGVSTRPGTHAVHTLDYYSKKYRLHPMDFPRAYAADRLSLALPLFHTMTLRDVAFVARRLLRAVGKGG